MSYIGNQPPDIGAYDVESFDGGGTSFTLKKAATTPSILLFIDGVRQTPTDAYSVSGVTLTTTATTPSGTDNVTVMFMGDVVDIGAPSDDAVSTAKIQDDAVTAAKLANSINTEIAANTAKVTNATHTGDVTGATALTIAADAVDIAMLSATGTADSTTFLRGDNSWVAISGGLAQASQWRLTTDFTGPASPIASNLEEVDTDGYARIGSAMTESSGVFTFPVTGIWYIEFWVRHLFDASSRFVVSYIYTTVDDGTWTQATESGDSIYSNGWVQAYTRSSLIFDVTSTSTHKCRFHVSGDNSGVYVTGNTGYTQTGMSFLKLGDT